MNDDRDPAVVRVLVIGPYPLDPGVIDGGVESATSALVAALAGRNDVARIAVLRLHTGGRTLVPYRRDGPKVEIFSVRGQTWLRAATRSTRDMRRVREVVARLQPDVVHGQGADRFGDLAVRSGRRSVVTIHGSQVLESRVEGRTGFRERLRMRLTARHIRQTLRSADVVVSPSTWADGEFAESVRGRSVRIANAVDDQFFALAPSPTTDPTVLFAAVLRPLKNPLGLLEAFARVHAAVPLARLVVVGPQPDPHFLTIVRERVRVLELSDCVDVIDRIDNSRLRVQITAARVVALFSDQENTPTIIAQAMAAGKPVVATRVGGVPEMIDDGRTGFLVPPADVTAFADRLTALLRDQGLCLDMGRRAHEEASQRFRSDRIAELTVDAYRTALVGREDNARGPRKTSWRRKR